MLAKAELYKKLDQEGIPRFRGKQILQAVFHEGKTEYSSITTLPENLRKELQDLCPISSIEPVIIKQSKDGATQKALFKTHDGKSMEAVLMRFKDGRNSVCVSSQVGCQLGCKFCATGTMKFGRNLTYEEIADQVLFFAQKLLPKGKRVTNIIYMGMGEPFMNYDNIMTSIRLLNDKDCLNIGARNITVSTSGICEKIDELAKEKIQVNLAVSLHAPDQATREKIMPIAKKYPLETLMEAIQNYLTKTKRRVSYEYVMLKGINDSEEQAALLADLVKDQLCHVNLIPYNATGIENISGSEKETIQRFRDIVAKSGVPVTIRVTMGEDIDAACGQLANKTEQSK